MIYRVTVEVYKYNIRDISEGLVLYVRIAVYGRITAVPYRTKHPKPQNTVRNVRSVTVYGPQQYGRYRIRYGAEP